MSLILDNPLICTNKWKKIWPPWKCFLNGHPLKHTEFSARLMFALLCCVVLCVCWAQSIKASVVTGRTQGCHYAARDPIAHSQKIFCITLKMYFTMYLLICTLPVPKKCLENHDILKPLATKLVKFRLFLIFIAHKQSVLKRAIL